MHVKSLYEIDDPVIKRKVVEIIGLNFKLQDQKLKIQAKNTFIAIHRIKKELWEQNLWLEPTNSLNYQAKQLYSGSSLFSGAYDGTGLEPIKLNYSTFFPNLEETQLLASQLTQLKDYLQLTNYAYLM